MGASVCDAAIGRRAYEVGRGIAERGAVLLCGGRGGVMEEAARGARDAGGLTVGIMPGANASESPPNAYVDVAIFTGMRDGRNWINACSSDAIIAISGGFGTLSEVALALKIGRPVVLLDAADFVGARVLGGLTHARDSLEAVAQAFAALG
jgi:hypothetical protein